MIFFPARLVKAHILSSSLFASHLSAARFQHFCSPPHPSFIPCFPRYHPLPAPHVTGIFGPFWARTRFTHVLRLFLLKPCLSVHFPVPLFKICMTAVAPSRSLSGQNSSKWALNYVGSIRAQCWHAKQLSKSVSMVIYHDQRKCAFRPLTVAWQHFSVPARVCMPFGSVSLTFSEARFR